MNSKGIGWWGWMMQLVAFVVLFVGVTSAHAWNINGTISNTSGRTGRVYMSLQQRGSG